MHVLHSRMYDYHVVLCVNSFKDMTSTVPKKAEWSHINVEDNRIFTTRSDKLMEAFSSRHILPFQELLKIFLGDSLDHRCSFCNATLTVVALAGEVMGACRQGKPLALLKPFAPSLFVCGRVACTEQLVDKKKTFSDDHLRRVEGN